MKRRAKQPLHSIYTLEKVYNKHATLHADPESSPLLDSDVDPDTTFRCALDSELENICSFYELKEQEIYGEVDELFRDEQGYIADAEDLDNEQNEGGRGARRYNRPRRGSILQNFGWGGVQRRASTLSQPSRHQDGEDDDEEEDSDEDDADESAALRKKPSKERRKTNDANGRHDSFHEDMLSSRELMHSSRELPTRSRRMSHNYDDGSDQALSVLFDAGITLKKRTISHYVSLCELKSFIQLNKTGFTKALKKYDKILDRALKNKYIEASVKPAYPFQPTTTQHIDEKIGRIEQSYADVVTKGDVALAKRELRLHLREHVVWERNTVWREMIGIERKAQAANLGIRQTLLGGDHGDPTQTQRQGDEVGVAATKEVVTPVGKCRCPTWLFSSTFFALVAIIAIFAVLLAVPIMNKPEQQNCLAMLVFVSLLWATEVFEQNVIHASDKAKAFRSFPSS